MVESHALDFLKSLESATSCLPCKYAALYGLDLRCKHSRLCSKEGMQHVFDHVLETVATIMVARIVASASTNTFFVLASV